MRFRRDLPDLPLLLVMACQFSRVALRLVLCHGLMRACADII